MEITDEDGEVVAEIAEGIGVATNNVAEYTAAIRGLERARELHHEARLLFKEFEEVRFEHVRRERNVEADALANRGVEDWLAGEGATWERSPPSPRLWELEEEPR